MGEEIRRGRGGREVEPRRKAGTAEVEAYEALPRRTGTTGNGGKAGWGRREDRLGTERGQLGTEGRQAGNGGKDSWGRREGRLGTGERIAGDGLRPLSAVP